jgi:hypothetical protein
MITIYPVKNTIVYPNAPGYLVCGVFYKTIKEAFHAACKFAGWK